MTSKLAATGLLVGRKAKQPFRPQRFRIASKMLAKAYSGFFF
jgi:hypothetical protein